MPKGGATSLIPVYAGLREDLDEFLKAFLAIKSQRFTDYKALFTQRGMVQLHNGRSDSAEIIEFNEHLLAHCLPYMEAEICPGTPRSTEERLFGLYSLYTFFYIQRPGLVVKCRIDPDSSRNFRHFSELLLDMKIYDAYMASLKLLEDKAFKHVGFVQQFDPSLFKQFGSVGVAKPPHVYINVNDPFARVKSLLDTDLIRKMGVIHKMYTGLKEKNRMDLEVEGMEKNPYEKLQDVLKASEIAYVEAKTTKGQPILPLLSERRNMSRMEIKETAYAADLHLERSRRHYTTDAIDVDQPEFDYEPEDAQNDEVKLELDSEPEEIDEPVAPKNKTKPKSKELKPVAPKLEVKPVKTEPKIWRTEKIKTSPVHKKTKKRVRAPTPKFVPKLPSGRKTNNSIASELFSNIVRSESEQKLPELDKDVKIEHVDSDSEKIEEKLPEKKLKGVLKRRADEKLYVKEETKEYNDEANLSICSAISLNL